MVKRSYHQHCGLAVALDALAERWTLLIVRDLLPGPRRFSDLFDALPGVSTDLLTERLRSLQEIGVVEQRQIRHPTPAKVYALTAEGEELRPILKQLATWGERLLPRPGSDDHRLHHRWALSSMAAAYNGGLPDGAYLLDVDDDQLTVHVAGATARLHYGPSVDEPVLSMRCTADWFFRSASAQEPAGRARSTAEFHGDESLVSAFFRALPLPAGDPL